MGCITTLLLGLISRISIVIWWIMNPQAHDLPFKGWVIPGGLVFPGWLWILLGLILLPWTTLAYLLLYPGGIVGSEWIIMGIALLLDIASHTGTYRNRSRFGGR